MTSVLLLTRYERLGASSRVRFLQFLPELERRGFTFDVRPLLDNDYVRSLYGGPRIGAGRLFMSYMRRFGALRRRLRYDDAWFHRYDMHWTRPLLGGKIDAIMQVAHTVVAGNDYIARRAREAGARQVEIVPSTIDLERYRGLPEPRHEGLTVGWIGIPLNAHYLSIIAPALRAVPSVRLHVVGGAVPAELSGIPAASFEWTEDSEIAQIAAFDVGIMPLHDTPWERGKCAYKLLQVMAAGKPVIASPVGANRQVVRHGINGFLAETTEQWADALRRLADPELRRRMGEEARRTVAAQYASAVVVPRLAAILSEAAAA